MAEDELRREPRPGHGDMPAAGTSEQSPQAQPTGAAASRAPGPSVPPVPPAPPAPKKPTSASTAARPPQQDPTARWPAWLVVLLAAAAVLVGWYAADWTAGRSGVSAPPVSPAAQAPAPDAAASPEPTPAAAAPDPDTSGSPATGPGSQPAPPGTADGPAPPIEVTLSFDLPGPIAVSVDNSPAARPQSGLSLADIVYEVPLAGESTRFLAIYHRKHAFFIGPVRSARVSLIDLVEAYGAVFAHAGGSAPALDLAARVLGERDFDEIYGSGAFFWRSDLREMPHNLYTNTQLLLGGIRDRNLQTRQGLGHAYGSLPPGGNPVAGIQLTFGAGVAAGPVEYRWTGQDFARYADGVPHPLDGGETVRTENVVVLLRGDGAAAGAEGRILGSGTAIFLRDGRMWTGQWRRPFEQSAFQFTLADGKPMLLAVGRVWVAVFPTAASPLQPAADAGTGTANP